jgi:hypothetical protein
MTYVRTKVTWMFYVFKETIFSTDSFPLCCIYLRAGLFAVEYIHTGLQV